MAKAPQRKPTRSATRPATKPSSTGKAKKSPIALAGEKTVKPTPASDVVKPVNVSKAAKKPMPQRAMDRRTAVEPGGPIGDGAS